MTRAARAPLIERAGDPLPRTRTFYVKLPVSTAFWRKARAIASTRMKVSELFEIAMDRAIEAHVRDHGIRALERPPALPDHTHWVYLVRERSVYFYGELGIGSTPSAGSSASAWRRSAATSARATATRSRCPGR